MKDTKLKELIKKEIDKTNELIEMYKEETKPVAPDCAIDRLSRNEALNNIIIAKTSLQQAKAKISALELILTKVGTPEFGKCVSCREEIPVGRILARPESLYCVKCSE